MCAIACRWIAEILFDCNIGSSNGLVPSGTKPLPEPILREIMLLVSRGFNELKHNPGEVIVAMIYWYVFICVLIASHICHSYFDNKYSLVSVGCGQCR